jgi:predicted cupin superfamily sugar epimerase
MSTAAFWVEKLGLQEHPEGGYYKETYGCKEFTKDLPVRFPTGVERRFSTAIYFLLESENISHFHRIKSDEGWHFYCGGSLTVHIINEAGEYSNLRLGADFERGQVFQAVVEQGTKFRP